MFLKKKEKRLKLIKFITLTYYMCHIKLFSLNCFTMLPSSRVKTLTNVKYVKYILEKKKIYKLLDFAAKCCVLFPFPLY